MGDLQRALAEAVAKEHARKQKELYDKRVETLIKIQSVLFDKAQSYTRIVFGLGYGGFFVFLAGTRSYMLAVEVVWSALLITFSLFFYIVYEIYQMIFHTTNLKELAKITDAPLEEFERRAEEHKHLVERKNRHLMKVWFVALVLTVIPGLVGALILINGFVRFLLTH